MFDFDGVIANSEPLHFGPTATCCPRTGVPLTRPTTTRATWDTTTTARLRRSPPTAGDAGRRAHPRRSIARRRRRLEALERVGSVLFPGAKAAIEAAAAAVPIAIASGALGRGNSPRARSREPDPILHGHRRRRGHARSKPAPIPTCWRWPCFDGLPTRCRPAQCVAVEDSRWGLASANAAGLRTVARRADLSAAALAPADLIIPSMGDFDLDVVARFS